MPRPGGRAGPRVLGYCRVSGTEQEKHGTSLDAQQDEIARYCKAHDLAKPTLFVEVESGASESRREFGRLIGDAAQGDIVIVTRLDRWSRDLVHAVKTIRDLTARGVRWLSIGDGIDATTPHGDGLLGIIAWAADFERKRIKERLVGTRKRLRDEGKFVEGLPPVGYRRGPGRVLVVDTGDAEIIRDMFARCIRGESLREIQHALRERWPGRQQWDRQVLHRMLRSRYYLGEVKTARGEWIASHEPIITRAELEQARLALVSRRLSGRPPGSSERTDQWLLRGLARCGLCGAGMGAAYSKSRRGAPLDYYACHSRLAKRGCVAGYVRVQPADEATGVLVVDHIGELRDELAGTAVAERNAPDFAGKRSRIEQRRERLIDMAADGTIGREQVRKRLDRAAAELAAVEEEERAHLRAVESAKPSARRELLREVRQLARAWKAASVPQRRDMVGLLAENVALEAGAEPRPVWKPVESLAL